MGGNGWQPAKATIDAKRESGKVALTLGASGVTGLGRKRYEYVVEVSPSDGTAPFRTTMVTPLLVDHWRPLEVGDVVSVLQKPGTEDVKWDRSEASTSRKAEWKALQERTKRSEDEAFESALRTGPQHRNG